MFTCDGGSTQQSTESSMYTPRPPCGPSGMASARSSDHLRFTSYSTLPPHHKSSQRSQLSDFHYVECLGSFLSHFACDGTRPLLCGCGLECLVRVSAAPDPFNGVSEVPLHVDHVARVPPHDKLVDCAARFGRTGFGTRTHLRRPLHREIPLVQATICGGAARRERQPGVTQSHILTLWAKEATAMGGDDVKRGRDVLRKHRRDVTLTTTRKPRKPL